MELRRKYSALVLCSALVAGGVLAPSLHSLMMMGVPQNAAMVHTNDTGGHHDEDTENTECPYLELFDTVGFADIQSCESQIVATPPELAANLPSEQAHESSHSSPPSTRGPPTQVQKLG